MTPSKDMRKKYGVTGMPTPATRVLVMEGDPAHFNGKQPRTLFIINERDKTLISMNTYDHAPGANWQAIAKPLPGPDSDKWKDYANRGYVKGEVKDHPALVLVTIKEDAKAKAPK